MNRIREARLTDYEALDQLHHLLDQHHVKLLPHIFQSFEGPARSRELIESKINDPDIGLFVAEEKEGLVGFAEVQRMESPAMAMAIPRKVAMLDSLFVIKEYRGCGLAKEMLRKVMGWTASKGLDAVQLKVYTPNKGAIRFYEKEGFEAISSTYEFEL